MSKQREKWLDQLQHLATAYGLTVERRTKPLVSGTAADRHTEVRHTLTISYTEGDE